MFVLWDSSVANDADQTSHHHVRELPLLARPLAAAAGLLVTQVVVFTILAALSG